MRAERYFMKRLLLLLTAVFLFPSIGLAKLKVVATIPDLAALTQEVGQDSVEVKSIARGDQDPHFLEPKPSYVVLVNQADLLIEVGLDLESGWLPVLMTQSRNPKVQTGRPGHLNASEGITILEIPEGKVDRSMGDVHPMGNPHYWLNPRNGLIIAGRITSRLKALDPEHGAAYDENFRRFEERLKGRIFEWEKTLQKIRGKKIITHHKSFSYLVDWAGLFVAGNVEPKPGIPPNPGHLLELIQVIEREKVPLILTENYYDPKPSRELSEKTGAKWLLLPTSVGGDPSAKTYEELFDLLVRKISEALL